MFVNPSPNWKAITVTCLEMPMTSENGAMIPTSTVSGLYISHPDARYFIVGEIGRDQIEDYASRRGLTPGEVENILSKNV